MKTETLLLIVAVGAVAYFAFRRPAQAQPTVVVQSAPQPPPQNAGGGFLQGVGRLLDQGIDYFTSDDQEEDVELLFFD